MSGLTFLDYIKYNILQIRTPELNEKVQIKELEDKIAENKVKFIDFKTKSLSIECANYIYEIYKTIGPFASIFKEDFSMKNSEFIAKHIIESDFTKEQKELYISFNKDNILEKIKETGNASEVFTKVKDNFRNFQKSVSSVQIAEMNAAFNMLKNFSQIYSFDFYLFLKFFDPMMAEANFSVAPKFKNTTSLQAVDDLIKLDSAIFAIIIKQDFIKYINTYLEYHGMPAVPEKNIKSFLSKIKYFQTTEILSDVIRYMLKDFSYRTISHVTNDNIYMNYLSSVTNTLKSDIETIIKNIKSEKIGKVRSKVFRGDIEIKKLPNLNDTYNNALEKNGCKIFECIEPLQYIETFIDEVYIKSIKNPLNDICVIAEFANKNRQKQYLDGFYNLNAVHEKIMKIDEAFTPSASEGKRLKSWIINRQRAQQNKVLVETMINKTDAAAKSIILETFNSLLDTTTILKGILEDCHNMTKKEILNGARIVHDGAINLNVVEDTMPQLDSFLALLKNFIR